jgi:hypothetical protein
MVACLPSKLKVLSSIPSTTERKKGRKEGEGREVRREGGRRKKREGRKEGRKEGRRKKEERKKDLCPWCLAHSFYKPRTHQSEKIGFRVLLR